MTFNLTTATIVCARKKSKSDEIEKKKHLQTLPALNQMYINRYINLKLKFINYIQSSYLFLVWGKTISFCRLRFNLLFDHIINMRIKSSANGHRFDSERLHLFYILISFYGKSLIELLKKHSVSLVGEQQ